MEKSEKVEIETVFPTEGALCPNCEAPVTGAFCQDCGQRHHTLLHPFRELVAEIFSTIFNIDNRLIQSVKLLVRPGRLTKTYLAGKRAQYISPFKLYLISSVIYFGLTSLLDTNNFLFIDMNHADDVNGLVTAFPRIMFVVVPAFALLLKAFHRSRLYAEHLVFALHVHAVWFLLSILSVIFATINVFEAQSWFEIALRFLVDAADTLAEIAVPVYLFMAMRYVYGTSRGKTLLQVFLLFTGYIMIIMAILILFVMVQTGELIDLSFN